MQQRTRRWLTVGGVLLALTLCATGRAAVQVRILGQPIELSPAPQLAEGVILGSPATVVGKLGCRFMSGGRESLIVISPEGRRIILVAGSSEMSIDGQVRRMAREAVMAGGRLICPLRPVLEAVGCVTRWDEDTEVLDVEVPLQAVDVYADEEGARIDVRAPLRVEGALFRIEEPQRFYVDLPGVTVELEHERTYVNLGSLLRVRWGQFKQRPAIARVVADLREPDDVRWEPDEDGLGGSLIVGDVHGDEPLIERHVAWITGISSRTDDGDTTLVRVELSDPVVFDYDVARRPPRVTVEFPDAAVQMPVAPLVVDGPFVQTASLEGSPGEPGLTLSLQMHQLVHFEVVESSDPPAVNLIFKRGRLRDKRVVVDPGHGGRDSGARGAHIYEKDVNLDVALQVASRLMAIGAQTVLTRESDVFVDLYDRPELANRIGADLFVSIHCNAMPKPNTGWGTESYYYHAHSKCLGLIMQAALVKALGRRDNGTRWANFCVIRESDMPAVLVELMYINHDEEESLLQRPEVRTAAAEAIVEGLRQYVEGTGTEAEHTEMGM